MCGVLEGREPASGDRTFIVPQAHLRSSRRPGKTDVANGFEPSDLHQYDFANGKYFALEVYGGEHPDVTISGWLPKISL
jgi:hypothetical protein